MNIGQAAGLKGKPPLKCFVDHIEAWSVNEIAINWNSAFAWVVSYLDEQASLSEPEDAEEGEAILETDPKPTE